MKDPQKQARIVIVDDETRNIELLANIFEDEYEVLFATNGEKALEIVRRFRPDVVLLDVMMPDIDGFEICSLLKSERFTADIPIIFITGLGDTEAETRGLELGASDYVTKPISPAIVKLRVDNQIELKRVRDLLTRQATLDGLTGLANRRTFDDALAREYARQSRASGQLSLIMIDIDFFKLFNDTYGHIAGDECLRKVARVIDTAACRPADISARYGGEEFVCILPETDYTGAFAVAERIRRDIITLSIAHSASSIANTVTASLGVCSVHCIPDRSPLNLLAQADELLYSAKKAGRNRVMGSYSGPVK
jgi:diguanylate cyclase (GGDEF)-like protein